MRSAKPGDKIASPLLLLLVAWDMRHFVETTYVLQVLRSTKVLGCHGAKASKVRLRDIVIIAQAKLYMFLAGLYAH